MSIRPGISDALLSLAGVRHVDEVEAFAAVGFKASGLLIPYRDESGEALVVNGHPFFRLRLDVPTGSAKYLSPADSGCQLFIPPGLAALLKPGCTLGIVEGEFKALALIEAGFPCVGIGGITSACPRDKVTREPALLPALAALIQSTKPARIAFIGDSDTALIHDFAREAVKLAALISVPVVLPRIPMDAPGKGPDDLREAWGNEFAAKWQDILNRPELITAQTKRAQLAVRLLKREREALNGLSGDAKDKARERLVSMAEAVSTDPLAAADAEEIAADAFGIKKSVFREAVKRHAETARNEAAERKTCEAVKALDIQGSNPLFFDGQSYWRKEDDGAFGKLCREDARLHLNEAGLSKKGDPSPCDEALHGLQKRNRVDYAGPLCGRPAGLHWENGLKVLATRGPNFIEGIAGKCPTITALIDNLLGRDAVDPATLTQAALLVAWLKLRRTALRKHKEHRPGQVLALVGPADCGKSLLQDAIITPALGGRCADPGLFFTGQTTFNADLWSSEHLALSDKSLDLDGAQRSKLRNELKRAVAAPDYPLHPKSRDAHTFRPVWAITLSSNDDPEAASNLPALDESFADKIIYLKCYAPPKPFYDAKDANGRADFAARLRAELPAFLEEVDRFTIPPELLKARFGITEWHHPDILDLLDAGDPLRQIEDVLAAWLESWPPQTESREIPTGDLFKELDASHNGNLARFKISSSPSHLGHQLAKLARHPRWIGRIARINSRRGGREQNQKVAGWRIKRRALE